MYSSNTDNNIIVIPKAVPWKERRGLIVHSIGTAKLISWIKEGRNIKGEKEKGS